MRTRKPIEWTPYKKAKGRLKKGRYLVWRTYNIGGARALTADFDGEKFVDAY